MRVITGALVAPSSPSRLTPGANCTRIVDGHCMNCPTSHETMFGSSSGHSAQGVASCAAAVSNAGGCGATNPSAAIISNATIQTRNLIVTPFADDSSEQTAWQAP